MDKTLRHGWRSSNLVLASQGFWYVPRLCSLRCEVAEWFGCWGAVLALCQDLRYLPSSCSGRTGRLIRFPQLIGGLVGLLALIAIGVGVGVSLSNKNKKNPNGNTSNSNSNGTNGSSGNNTDNPVSQSDPNDPSTFEKDPRLKQSFYGMAYTPNGVLYPDCNATLQDVIIDIQLMSQLTKVSLHNRVPRFLGIHRASRRRGLFLGQIVNVEI